MASQAPALHSSRPAAAHLHIGDEICPWCEQPIPHEKFQEISDRIQAREREKFSSIKVRLQEQFAQERAKSEVERAAELAQVRAELTASAAAERTQAVAAAESAAEAKLAIIASARDEAEGRLAEVETAGVELRRKLEEADTAMKEAAREAAEQAEIREASAREGGRLEAEGALQVRLAEVDGARVAAEERATALETSQEATIAARVQEVRDALTKDRDAAVNAERTLAFNERMKLNDKLQDVQRQLDKKTNEELGEGAEINLCEALKDEFPSDRIERVGHGEAGADIIHTVLHNGNECGRIVYDCKNRNAWRNDYVTKLATDQMAAKAEHAILSTLKLPANHHQFLVQDGVIVANPARVVALVQLVRRHLVQTHTMRLSNNERSQKTAALYDFITSERCTGLFEKIVTHTDALLDLQVKEKKWHDLNWKHQGELLRSVQRVKGELTTEIDQIIAAI